MLIWKTDERENMNYKGEPPKNIYLKYGVWDEHETWKFWILVLTLVQHLIPFQKPWNMVRERVYNH